MNHETEVTFQGKNLDTVKVGGLWVPPWGQRLTMQLDTAEAGAGGATLGTGAAGLGPAGPAGWQCPWALFRAVFCNHGVGVPGPHIGHPGPGLSVCGIGNRRQKGLGVWGIPTGLEHTGEFGVLWGWAVGCRLARRQQGDMLRCGLWRALFLGVVGGMAVPRLAQGVGSGGWWGSGPSGVLTGWPCRAPPCR